MDYHSGKLLYAVCMESIYLLFVFILICFSTVQQLLGCLNLKSKHDRIHIKIY